NRLVAIKMILAADYADHQTRARFQAEAELAARMHHPNITQIYEMGEHNGHPYFSLEYVPGGPLDRRLAAGPPNPAAAADLVGKPPFKGANALDTLVQVRTAKPVPPRRIRPQVPSGLEMICLRCLEKEPTRRYRSAEKLADDLRHFQEGKPPVDGGTPVTGKW